jgi:hypothetical protein
MFKKLFFYCFLIQFRFAKALSRLRADASPVTGWQLWAAYRLGLYQTVASSSWDGKHLQGGFALVVSLAACGRSHHARDILNQLRSRHTPRRFYRNLADALAPFEPDLALSLLASQDNPDTLYLALQLRTGQKNAAAASIREMLERGFGHRMSELWLLGTNALDGSPDEQLWRLNQWLEHFKLPPLALRDTTSPPGPGNLQSRITCSSLEGGPLVSVLMTSFNSANHILGSLDGLLNQSWKNLEIIVADDASDDDTAAIVQAISVKDARVKLLRLPFNVGTYAAKTAALKLAQGEFVTCHDADDWSHPLRIELQVRPLLRNPRLVATTSQWVRMESSGHFYARPVHPLARLNPASPLFRRAIVTKKMGAWDCVRTGADSEFHARLRLVFGRRAVLRIKLPLTLGLHRPNSLMTAADTGYSAAGISPTRLAYWESWTHWHIDCLRNKQPLQMPAFDEPRVFSAPDKISVNIQHVKQCMQAADNAHALLR